MEPVKSNESGNFGRRRSSAGSTKFAGLMDLKRNSTDAALDARRQSFADSKPTPGFVGKLWHNFTRGPSGSST